MDLEKFRLKFLLISNIINYIVSQKEVSAIDIEEKFNIPQTTAYRYLDLWCDRGFLSIKDRRGRNRDRRRKIFKITNKGIRFFMEFRKSVLDIFLFSYDGRIL